jgi:hypothetical protein
LISSPDFAGLIARVKPAKKTNKLIFKGMKSLCFFNSIVHLKNNTPQLEKIINRISGIDEI